MTGCTIKIDTTVCDPERCDRICESIFPGFLVRVPIKVHEWSMEEHGENYSKIMNAIRYCPRQAIFLEAK